MKQYARFELTAPNTAAPLRSLSPSFINERYWEPTNLDDLQKEGWKVIDASAHRILYDTTIFILEREIK